VQGMYSSLRELRTASAKPPARAARRVLGSNVGSLCNSKRKRWTQRSQFTRIPRKPSQTPTNMAACEITFHAIVIAHASQEAVRRRPEAALVEARQTDDVALRWVGNSIPIRWHDPLRRLPIHVRRQLAAGH
jgi:hypothetical protein